MDRLMAFNPKPICPKCGDKDIFRIYHSAGWRGPDCALGSGDHQEHHDMYCRGCSYQWAQRVKGE